MKLEITNTERGGFSTMIIQCLAMNSDVADWISRMARFKIGPAPEDLIIRIDGDEYNLIKNGQAAENMTDIIGKIRELPPDMRMIPPENLEIKADIMSKSLYFDFGEAKEN